MLVVFDSYFGKGSSLFYFLLRYSSLLICLRTSHNLPNHEPQVFEYMSGRNVTWKLHRALQGPVRRPVLPPHALVRPLTWKKTDWTVRNTAHAASLPPLMKSICPDFPLALTYTFPNPGWEVLRPRVILTTGGGILFQTDASAWERNQPSEGEQWAAQWHLHFPARGPLLKYQAFNTPTRVNKADHSNKIPIPRESSDLSSNPINPIPESDLPRKNVPLLKTNCASNKQCCYANKKQNPVRVFERTSTYT